MYQVICVSSYIGVKLYRCQVICVTSYICVTLYMCQIIGVSSYMCVKLTGCGLCVVIIMSSGVICIQYF